MKYCYVWYRPFWVTGQEFKDWNVINSTKYEIVERLYDVDMYLIRRREDERNPVPSNPSSEIRRDNA